MAKPEKAGVRIRSRAYDLEDGGERKAEEYDKTHKGTIERDGGRVIVRYRDADAGDICEMIYDGAGRLTVQRTGNGARRIVFEEGHTHRDLFSAPPYSIDMEVRTRSLSLSDEGGFRADIEYLLDIGGQARRMEYSVELLPPGRDKWK